MMIALHIVVGVLIVLLMILHYLDYRELKKEQAMNTDILFTLFAYRIFYGDMDEAKIQKAHDALQEMIRKEQDER